MTEAITDDSAVDFDPFAGGPVLKVVPTTEAQREIWLADQLGSDASRAYNESISLVWEGPMDLAALTAALADLTARHEALRGKLGADGMDLWIGEDLALPVERHDFSTIAAADRPGVVAAERTRAVELRFDLANGPLIRAVLLQFGPLRYELILSAHHIVCDGWSFGILARELVKTYRARTAGTVPALAPAHGFGDFAVSLTQPTAQEQLRVDQAYWTEIYASSIPILDLPCDQPRRPTRTFASRRIDLPVAAQAVKDIRKVGVRHGVSLYAVLFGVFSALVGRLSGQDDVVVGIAAAGQSVLDNPNLVGHCVNLLPVRARLAGIDQVGDLVTAASRNILDAFEHQQCTFGSLLQKLQLVRDPSRLPLVSILFNLDQAIPTAELSDPVLRIGVRGNPRHFENFELFLNISQIDDGLVLECQYQTGLFEAKTVERWLGLYSLALQRIAAEPGMGIAAALAPSPADLAVLDTLNTTYAEHDRTWRIDSLIAAQALKTPDAIAIRAGKHSLTYRELDARADTLAAALWAEGFGAGDLVGLACPRDHRMLVGLYGILKSGAAYVPLDPEFPADRLTFMAADAGLRVVVTDGATSGDWKFGEAKHMSVDAPAPGMVAAAVPTKSAADVAYVIYTSGSTGRPKGVRVTHANVANLLAGFSQTLGLQVGDKALSVTTLSFDIAVMEVILPLTVGATVVVSDRNQAKDGDRLRALIEAEDVTFVNATPSTWRLLLEAEWKGRRDLRALCGGEAFPSELAAALLPAVGSLWNVYGPTETTVWSSMHRVTRAEATIPIGRPIANTQFHVLDAALEPLPVGVIGELYIGGEGVTLGYLDRPELTAERFVSDRFTESAAGRIYRTGDLGRVRNDGLLECLGRIDHQVKVRGYRIELGEIEAVLADHPDLAHVLVVTREDRPGDVRIIAYAVAKQVMPTAETLRSYAGRRLPDYMIPQHFIALERIPLLPNGKVDRRALPAPDAAALPAGSEIPPRDDTERRVLAAMEEVLNLPGFGIQGDFFTLGGHSLLAARLVSRLNRELEIHLPLRSIFEAPTAERLAAMIKSGNTAPQPKREPLVALPGRDRAPLMPMQSRVRFVEELHPGNVLYNTPSAHRLTGPFDTNLFAAALRLLVERQPSLRTAIAPNAAGDDYEQHVLAACPVEMPVIDLSEIPAAQQEQTLMRELQAATDRPLDIYRAPLFRSAIYRLAPECHVFFFMPHHIIWDGWSFDLLYGELGSIYEAVLAGEPVTLPPLQLTYGDYADWFARWLEGPEAAAQLSYWRDRFAKAPALKPVVPDFPRNSGMTGVGASEWITVVPELTHRLHGVSNAAQATLNMLTTAVYAALMASAIDSSSIVIGIPVRGRSMGDVESVMGFFNNLLPVQLEVDARLSFEAFLRKAKLELLDVLGHQEIPFERIAQLPEVRSRTQGTGLYQALFSFQDARDRKRRWGPLQQENIPLLQKGATEDFGLWLMEGSFGLQGGITYNADLFSRSTALAVRERYLELLKRVADDPQITLAKLIDIRGSESGEYLRRLSAKSLGPAAGEPATKKMRTAPTLSPPERALGEIWVGLLDMSVSELHPDDNFFDLGGDSLRAMRAVELASKNLGVHIDARRYLHEKLAGLAATPSSGLPAAGKSKPGGSLLRRLFGARSG